MHQSQANTKKQKYQRILERKQATHPEQLCKGYPTEFRDFFAHCSSLGFEDRPDYRYLKRIFKDLFDRQALEDDGQYDWDLLTRHQEQGTGTFPVPLPEPPKHETGDDDGGADAGDGGGGGDEGSAKAGLWGREAPPQTASSTGGGSMAFGVSVLASSAVVATPVVVAEPVPTEASAPKRGIISSIRHSLFGSRSSRDAAPASKSSR